MENATPLWKKSNAHTEDWVTRFTVGDDPHWDTLLLPYDIEATRAHANGLAQIELLDGAELDAVEKCLDELLEKALAGEVRVTMADEDCHTLIENFLTDELGEAGRKIHAGRSRNDQVLAALRLFLRDQLEALGGQTITLVEALCDIGEAHDDKLMPGYTHMQRAMPSTAGCWAMGFAEVLAADLQTLRHAHEQVNVSPLGSAAGYGVPHLALPREETAERLGFRKAHRHPTSVQLTRGKLELLVVHAVQQVAATINRLASDLVLYSTAEFDFVKLPEAYTTGSSIMPQKRNPDVLELARAAYHGIASKAQQLSSLPANLSSGYHRDLQPTKAAAMESVMEADDLLTAMNEVLDGIQFNEDRMREACSPELFATSAALKKVVEGVPFRDAYRQAAEGIDQLETPSTQDALAAYKLDGYPGNVRPDLTREGLQEHRAWAGKGGTFAEG